MWQGNRLWPSHKLCQAACRRQVFACCLLDRVWVTYLHLMQLSFQLLKFKFDGSLFCVQPIVLRGLSERAHSRQRGLHSRYALIQSVFLHCFRHQRWLGGA